MVLIFFSFISGEKEKEKFSFYIRLWSGNKFFVASDSEFDEHCASHAKKKENNWFVMQSSSLKWCRRKIGGKTQKASKPDLREKQIGRRRKLVITYADETCRLIFVSDFYIDRLVFP